MPRQPSNVTSIAAAGLPEPLVPADARARIGSVPYMPLYGDKLFTSSFVARASPAARWAGLRLWWAAWTSEIPSSLPNEERLLADLAGYGRDMRGWRAVREVVMSKFVLCKDNRWYHTAQAEMVNDLLERRRKEAERRRHQRETGGGPAGGTPRDPGGKSGKPQAGVQGDQGVAGGAEADTPPQVKGSEVNPPESPTGDSAAPPAGRAAPAGEGLPLLVDGHEELKQEEWDEARSMLGRVAPAMARGTRSKLVNALVRAHGGGLQGMFQAIDTLRDVKRRALTKNLPGYTMSKADEEDAATEDERMEAAAARAKAVEDYIWAIVSKRAEANRATVAAAIGRNGAQDNDPGLEAGATPAMRARAYMRREAAAAGGAEV